MPIYEYECQKCKKHLRIYAGDQGAEEGDLRGVRRLAGAADFSVGIRAQGRRLVQRFVLVVEEARVEDAKRKTEVDKPEQERKKMTMSAEIIDGKAIAARGARRGQGRGATRSGASGVQPGLAVVLVGDDPASQVYVRNKTKAAARGRASRPFDHKLPADTTRGGAAGARRASSTPIRASTASWCSCRCRSRSTQKRVIEAIAPTRTSTGLHPANLGQLWAGEPALRRRARRRAACGCSPSRSATLAGADAVVIGRSQPGRASRWRRCCSARNATVTCATRRRATCRTWCAAPTSWSRRSASAELVRGDWIKPGATVLDVGMNRTPTASSSATSSSRRPRARARAITPVPGGVGPMTIAMLLANTARRAL